MSVPPDRSRDHVARGLMKLTEQFRGLPIMRSILSSYLRRVQELEDAVWTVWVARLVPTGVFLTWLGEIVGRGRGGLSDSDFLRIIQAQILANRSHGNTPTLLAILAYASPESTMHELRPAYPAGLRLESVGYFPVASVRELLSTAIVAGVRLHMIVAPPGAIEDDNVFAASEIYGEEQDDPDRGPGSSYDPTVGGLAAHSLFAE